MDRRFFVAGLVAVLAAGASVAAAEPSSNAAARGKYLVDSLGCTHCHTPMTMGPKGPESDPTRFLAGHPQDLKMPPAPKPQGPWLWSGAATNTAFAGPWGVSFATNLTPDPTTGLGGGGWSEEVFVKALKTGKHFGTARPIQPPMPWDAYRNLSDADLKAVWAYLKTVKRVKNLVPDYEPPPAPAK